MKMITDIETVHSSVELAFTGDRARRSEAYAAGGRFCRAARMLVSGRLWFQISYVRSGEPSVTSFSDAADVTAEDHRWIFRSCAEAAELPCERPSGLFAGGRKVYALLPARGKGGGDRGYADTDLTDEGFAEASEMLMGSGAVIRMYAGVDTDGSMRCALFLSLEESMALRLRAALSDALPSAVFEEVTPDDPDPAERKLPPSAVRDAIGGFTYELMAKAEALRREEPGKEPDVPRAVHGGHTPLEELGLSVRAYNCLKRAGVCSVEQLRAMSAGDLIRIRNLGTKCADEILRKLGGARSPERRQTRVENGMEALDGMVGLDEIKEQVRRIAAFARMRHAMAESGEKDVPVVLNMEFIGNPGTAKTTAARALAGILGDMGILSSPEPLEVGRADLVAEYVGQTAVKVRDVFERAKGRLLFIDEAYSLADGRGGYGDEALSAIVQEMENSPGDPVVIFAGYPDEMDRLFSRNPGLRSRVPFTVRFPDYTAEEMARITELEARKRGFGVSEEGRRRILSICTEAQGRRGTGNGRFCRNLAESAILRYAARACGDGDAFPEGERLLTEKDFTAPALPRKERRTAPIGFRA